MIRKLLNKLTNRGGKPAEPYKQLEIEATIKCYTSDPVHPFRLHLKVVHKGSFFTKDIFIREAGDRARFELFFNYSALGMNEEELARYGATDCAEYGFASLEETKKVKEATVQYIRFLCREHQESVQKIS